MNKVLIDFANANRSPDDAALLQKILSFIECSTNKQDIWYWYPLYDIRDNAPVAAYDLSKIYAHSKMTFLDSHKINFLAKVLKQCNVNSAFSFQLQTSENGLKKHLVILKNLLFEKDKDGYNFPWNVETYYFDRSEKWMIYVSHESTITFAGDDIVKAAKETIPSKYLINR